MFPKVGPAPKRMEVCGGRGPPAAGTFVAVPCSDPPPQTHFPRRIDMADLLQAFADALKMIGPLATALVPPTMMAMGYVPRVGPGRAFVLAARSLLSRAKIVSRREDATSTLRIMLQTLGEDQYVVVTGQKGSASLSS